MKKYLMMIVTMFVGWGCSQTNNEEKMTFSEMVIGFESPSQDYRPAPLWTWNTIVTKDLIDHSLEQFKEAGFGGAFIHPRPGLVTEYLSDEWYDLYDYAIEKGASLGLNIWIYDENSYPSGFAGGHVPESMPESYDQGQGLAMQKAEKLPEDAGQYFCILKKDGDNYSDITKTFEQYLNTEGEYCLFSKRQFGRSPWYAGFSYVDLLADGVTEKFMDVTMSGYEKRFGDKFGKTVKGVFTDEPGVDCPGGIRWTPNLFEVFERRWGYDLRLTLPSLFEHSGDWKKVRHNYMQTLLDLFVDRWAKPWFEYTEQKGLIWTGHYWEHAWPDMRFGPDNMAMYAWHQMPAIDMLFNQYNEESAQAQFGNIRAVKELRSVANQMGYERTLSETYGGGGWDVTFEDLKRLGDWEYVLGVNFMNQHFTNMTLVGARKYDYPPFFSYHSTWWPHYKVLNDYFSRLSFVLSKGVQDNDILVIEPTTSMWISYSYAGMDPNIWQDAHKFQGFVTKIEKAQVEYDLGSENIIRDKGSVNKGRFIVGKASYSTVIIPYSMTNLNSQTFGLLKEYVNQGGKIIAFSKPELIDGAPSAELDSFVNQTGLIEFYNELNDDIIKRLFDQKKIKFEGVSGGNLYHQRREYADGNLIYLVNSSLEESSAGRIVIPAKTLLEMDAFTGDVYTYPFEEGDEGLVTVSFNLPPAGSLLLYAADENISKYQSRDRRETVKIIDSQGISHITRQKQNALMIDFCDLTIGNDSYKNIHFADAAAKYFNHAGFPAGDPWAVAVQFRSEVVDRDTMTTGKADVTYRFNVASGVNTDDMKLVVERPEQWSVSINGQKIEAEKDKWWLDVSFGVYDISKFVRVGENVVGIHIEPFHVHAEIEPVYITGDFNVVPATKGWDIVKAEPVGLGSWKTQGMPFYSWDIGYSKKYSITDISEVYKIKVPSWKGTVIEVFVNNEYAGIIAFQPYELDVTKYIKEGENSVEVRIMGSHRSLLGPHHKDEAPGFAGPGSWRGITGPQPAGEKYKMIDYGLIEDFQLISSK